MAGALLVAWLAGGILPDLEGELQKLNSKDMKDRLSALHELEKIGERAVAPLIKRVKGDDAILRDFAVVALSKIGPPAVKEVALLTSSTHIPLRQAAYRVLGNILDKGAAEQLLKGIQEKGKSRELALDAFSVLLGNAYRTLEVGVLREYRAVLLTSIECQDVIPELELRGLMAFLTTEGVGAALLVGLGDKAEPLRSSAADSVRGVARVLLRCQEPPIQGSLRSRNLVASPAAPAVPVVESAALVQALTARIVPKLIEGLASPTFDVRKASASGLKALSGRDFEFVEADWKGWWEENRLTFLVEKRP